MRGLLVLALAGTTDEWIREDVPASSPLRRLLLDDTVAVAGILAAAAEGGVLPSPTRRSLLLVSTIHEMTATTVTPDRHRNPLGRQRRGGPFFPAPWPGSNPTVHSCRCPTSPPCPGDGLGRVWSIYPKFSPAMRGGWRTWPPSCGWIRRSTPWSWNATATARVAVGGKRSD